MSRALAQRLTGDILPDPLGATSAAIHCVKCKSHDERRSFAYFAQILSAEPGSSPGFAIPARIPVDTMDRSPVTGLPAGPLHQAVCGSGSIPYPVPAEVAGGSRQSPRGADPMRPMRLGTAIRPLDDVGQEPDQVQMGAGTATPQHQIDEAVGF